MAFPWLFLWQSPRRKPTGFEHPLRQQWGRWASSGCHPPIDRSRFFVT